MKQLMKDVETLLLQFRYEPKVILLGNNIMKIKFISKKKYSPEIFVTPYGIRAVAEPFADNANEMAKYAARNMEASFLMKKLSQMPLGEITYFDVYDSGWTFVRITKEVKRNA